MNITTNLKAWVFRVAIDRIWSIEDQYWKIKDNGKFAIDFDLFGRDREPLFSSAIKFAIKVFLWKMNWKELSPSELLEEFKKISS